MDKDRNEGDGNLPRISLIILVAVMIMLFAVVFAVLGKGEYQPPPPEEQGSSIVL